MVSPGPGAEEEERGWKQGLSGKSLVRCQPSAAPRPPGLSWAAVFPGGSRLGSHPLPSLAKSEADVSSEPIAGSSTCALGGHNQHEDERVCREEEMAGGGSWWGSHQRRFKSRLCPLLARTLGNCDDLLASVSPCGNEDDLLWRVHRAVWTRENPRCLVNNESWSVEAAVSSHPRIMETHPRIIETPFRVLREGGSSPPQKTGSFPHKKCFVDGRGLRAAGIYSHSTTDPGNPYRYLLAPVAWYQIPDPEFSKGSSLHPDLPGDEMTAQAGTLASRPSPAWKSQKSLENMSYGGERPEDNVA